MNRVLRAIAVAGFCGTMACQLGPRPTECQQKEQVCYRKDIECIKRQLKTESPIGDCSAAKRDCLTALTAAGCMLEGPINGMGVWVFNNRADYQLLEQHMRGGRVVGPAKEAQPSPEIKR